MGYSEYIKRAKVEEWKQFYIDYDSLKTHIEEIQQHVMGSERLFFFQLQQELDKCDGFYQDMCHQILEQADQKTETGDDLKQKILRIDKFAVQNQVALQKLLHKHDAVSTKKLTDFYKYHANRDSFCSFSALEPLLARLSQIYSTERNAESSKQEEKAEDEQIGMSFQRTSIKFWIRPELLSKVICTIVKHIPVFNFARNSDFAQNISSVYLDTASLDLYHRRLTKEEGSQLIRLRWYGSIDQVKTVFVERKLHHDSWRVDSSSKERFPLRFNEVLPLLQGNLPLSPDFYQQHPLAEQVNTAIHQLQLRPTVRTRCRRTAFQFSSSDSNSSSSRYRLSLDTSLAMLREKVDGQQELWYTPEAAFREEDVHLFPFSVLEIKLESGTPPGWLFRLMTGPLVIRMDKFSKYCHGCAVLFPAPRVRELPYWMGDIQQILCQSVKLLGQEGEEFARLPNVETPFLKRIGFENGVIPAPLLPPFSFRSHFSPLPSPSLPPLSQWSVTGGTIAGYAMLETPTTQSPTHVWLVSPTARSSFSFQPNTRVGSAVEDTTTLATYLLNEEHKESDSHEIEAVQTGCWNCACCGCCSQESAIARINQRMKIEPKSFFANERTFLNWFSSATLFSSVGLALCHLSEARSLGTSLLVFALVLLMYGLYQFHRRLHALTSRQNSGSFRDVVAPYLVVFVMMVVLIYCLVSESSLSFIHKSGVPRT